MATRYGWMADTSEAAFRQLVEIERQASAGEKLVRALELSAMLMRMSESSVRDLHPAADDQEVFLRAAARRLDRDLMVRVYGWNPETGGAP